MNWVTVGIDPAPRKLAGVWLDGEPRIGSRELPKGRTGVYGRENSND